MEPLMYIVLFGLVLIVYAMILPKAKRPAVTQAQATVKEIEETMETFAAELDEQNQAVIQLFAENRKAYDTHIAKLEARIEHLERQDAIRSKDLVALQMEQRKLEEKLISSSSQSVASPIAIPSQPVQSEPTPSPELSIEKPAALMNIRDRYTEVFEMYDQGKSTDQIAKKLEMTKGEVNLIVQLAKQEEQIRVQ